MIVISGGTVLTEDGWIVADVAMEGETVVAVGESPHGADVIDASGCLVGPGFVDLHTHLREPGETWKEDIASGTRSAARGGYTAVTAMPNTTPTIDSVDLVESVIASARDTGVVDVFVSGALTLGRRGEEPADLEGMHAAGVRLFTDDGDALVSSQVLLEVMHRLARLDGAVLAQHAEDPEQTPGGHMHEGAVSELLEMGGLPSSAEVEIIGRDLDLMVETGVRYHCQHVSALGSVELIRSAKSRGLPVTAEVTPHHLTFDEDSVGTLDPDFKMYPPLRHGDDRRALRDGLVDGTIDAVATDHAPHARHEKDVPFELAPRGVIGLETAASAVWEQLADPGRFFDVMSVSPARIAGLSGHGRPVAPGTVANLVVFDPNGQWHVQGFESRSANSPYRGRTMPGVVRATIHRGRVAHRAQSVAA